MNERLVSKGTRIVDPPICEGPIIGPPPDAGEQLADQLRQWMQANGMLKDGHPKPSE